MRSEKKITEGIKLPNQENKSERSEKRKPTNTWEYWNRSKIIGDEIKDKKECLLMKKLVETKLSCRNLIKGINT